jgi:hypothetical protein
MDEIEKKVNRLWDRYRSGTLPNDINLIKVLNRLKKTLPKGKTSGLLHIISMSLQPPSACAIPVEGVDSVYMVKKTNKRILLLGISSESSSIYPFIADCLRNQLPMHIDMYINYPYTKNAKALEMVKGSYRAGSIFSLDRPRSDIYQNVRFHACDTRVEWIATGDKQFEREKNLMDRVHLLGIYSNYVATGDKKEFMKGMASSHIDFNVLLTIDNDLIKLQGKVMKSYAKNSDKPLADQMITYYHSLVKPVRLRLNRLKSEWRSPNHAILSVDQYLEFMKHLNSVYQYINILYTMLRMFRSFEDKPGQYSGNPDNCIVLLPTPMVQAISVFLAKYISWTQTVELHQSICGEALQKVLAVWKQ